MQDSTLLAQDSIWITFKVWERGVWRTAQSLLVDSSDPSEVERTVVKYMRKEQMRLYDTDLNILLIPERDIDINEELEASVSQLFPNQTRK